MTSFDPHVVAEAQHGDESAREQLLLAIQPILRAFFTSRIGRVPDVDDLIQNTLIRVHRGLRDLKNPERFKAFAMKAALFELQDFYRGRYSAREALYDPDIPPADPSGTGTTSLRIDLERAMDVLTPHARRIIELRELGYPYSDIAGLLETTEAAVKMQVKRAFERLRSALTAILLALSSTPSI
ncbi:MAG: sigma-70 family RNA polymerase sigma factor [Rubricoccaceae bacterium]|nr:sigma-70 family RNA polymerase sigma factor [Rubricoccaceae bacterium]